METVKLFYDNAYTMDFVGKVVSCEPKGKNFAVVLEGTYFYPEGGGQPADIGTLGGAKVTDVREKDGVISHITDKPLEVGAEVEGHIDWNHRFDLMQNHSGEHILSGIICGKYGCDNVGFHMGKDAILIDFNTKTLRKICLCWSELPTKPSGGMWLLRLLILPKKNWKSWNTAAKRHWKGKCASWQSGNMTAVHAAAPMCRKPEKSVW